MERFWNIFWKGFGIIIIALLAAGAAGGIIIQSTDFAYTVIQRTMAIGLGICGLIGFVVVPLEMYLEDRSQTKKADTAV
ncbi:MAG: hypothetical protein LBP20_01400 [Treponema sp.]|nr:hypothetical protein [Treponema sp.]